jgi:hypothetical protein
MVPPMKRAAWSLALAWHFCLGQEVAPPALEPTPAAEFPDLAVAGHTITTSSSRQFRISGGEPNLRSSMAFLAENVKADFLALGQEKDQWKVPISLMLHGKQGDPIPRRSIVIDLQWGEDGFKLNLHAHLAQGVDQARLRSALLATLLYEKSLRTIPPGPLEERLLVRPWLVEGLSEMIEWRRGNSDRRLYQSVFQAGGLFDLEEMLDMSQTEFDESDSVLRMGFRVSACGLLMALLEQPSGDQAFHAFLNEAAQFGGDMPVLLRKHFPGLNLSKKSLEKWWSLQMANQSRNTLTEVMTIQETDLALTEALKLRFRDEQGIPRDRDLSSWQELATLEESAKLPSIRHAEESLARLSYRCFPSYRKLLSDYQVLLRAMIQTKPKIDISTKLRELEESRLLMNQRGERAIDYLDWFEITRARETSGVFDDYMKLKQRLDQGLMQHQDHLSHYLDRVDRLYQR